MTAGLPAQSVSRRGAERLAQVLRAAVEPLVVAPGDVLVQQGDEGQTFFLLESGAVDVVVTADEGLRLPVARLGPGSHFGEMSLLTGTPVSADVVACEPSVLYPVSREQFEQVIRPDQELMEFLAGELASRLKSTNDRLTGLEQRRAALGKLIGAQRGHPCATDLPSYGRKLQAAVQEAARAREPLLITGDEGVGKRALARHIHSLGERADGPFLIADCRDVPPEDAHEQLFGDTEPDHVTRFADRLGYLQAADGGTLVLANVDRLPIDVQDDLARFLDAHAGRPSDTDVDVRVVATVCDAPESLEQRDSVSEALRKKLLSEHVISLAPLRRRRRDIVPLAEHFVRCLARQSGTETKTLSEAARRELLGYDYRMGNVRELLQVIELAIHLADGEVIHAEHVFFGVGGGGEGAQLDLLSWPWLGRLAADRRALNALKAIVAAGFFAIIVICLVAPDSAVGRLMNSLTWGTWWPALVVSLVFLGRVWCAVCPLGSGGETVQRLKGQGLEPPDWLQHVGPSLALVGFVAIVWVEQMTHMTAHPSYTAVLLIALALLAAVAAALFQRHTWCRYLCPLGAMGAVFSVASALRIRAQREVCGGQCTGHECYKGSESAEGCPMFNHAMFLTGGQYCKLCMECLRSCPSQSPRLVLQPPLRDIWRSDLIRAEVAPLAVVVALMALLLAGTGVINLATLEGRAWFTIGSVAIVAVGLALTALLRRRRESESSRAVSWTARAIYAYTPAAGALLFAFHLQALPGIHEIALGVEAGPVGAYSVTLLRLVQWVIAMGGSLLTLWALWAVCRSRFTEGLATVLIIWAALGFLAVFAVIEALMLLG